MTDRDGHRHRETGTMRKGDRKGQTDRQRQRQRDGDRQTDRQKSGAWTILNDVGHG